MRMRIMMRMMSMMMSTSPMSADGSDGGCDGGDCSSSYLASSLSHVSCPYASNVDAVLSLIVGGARIKFKK